MWYFQFWPSLFFCLKSQDTLTFFLLQIFSANIWSYFFIILLLLSMTFKNSVLEHNVIYIFTLKYSSFIQYNFILWIFCSILLWISIWWYEGILFCYFQWKINNLRLFDYLWAMKKFQDAFVIIKLEMVHSSFFFFFKWIRRSWGIGIFCNVLYELFIFVFPCSYYLCWKIMAH